MNKLMPTMLARNICGQLPLPKKVGRLLLHLSRRHPQVLLEERDRQAVEREREAEERTARLMEEERNRNDAGQRALYDLIVTMCQNSGTTPPPMPVIAPAGTHNSRQASTDPSPSATGATGPTPTPS